MPPEDLSFVLKLIWLPSQSWDGNKLASKVGGMIENQVRAEVEKLITISPSKRSLIRNRHHFIQIQSYILDRYINVGWELAWCKKLDLA